MLWLVANKGSKLCLPMADRHYNRQAVGSRQFCPPGRTVVLRTAAADAFWVSSWPRYSRHAWAGA